MVLAILTLSHVITATVVVWTSLQITSDLSHMYFQQSRILTYHMHVFPAELDFDLFTCVYFQPSSILTYVPVCISSRAWIWPITCVYFQPSSTTPAQAGYRLHQLQGNKTHGSVKEGYLLKKSEGMLKKMWQKRKCAIKDGIMLISHSDVSSHNMDMCFICGDFTFHNLRQTCFICGDFTFHNLRRTCFICGDFTFHNLR